MDNQATIAISNNPVFYGITKHFKIKLYFLRDVQKKGLVQLKYCKSEDQVADIFTKALSKIRSEFLGLKLEVCISLDARRSVVDVHLNTTTTKSDAKVAKLLLVFYGYC
ncbi:hypothetical protein Pint_05983 [Pistacia integerrima]|uniref:Uncharacterized protein n=1 Tax=Pistacia integerrima TaxID=434235 RepID=A0ACC0Z3J2_9ROSI|nr:hypothetical protein Pint_05983 [Pistacia integerrima]